MLVPCFSGCNSIKKPWSYENVVWSSENPQLTIIKDKDNYFEGTLLSPEGQLKVKLLWGPGKTFTLIENLEDVSSTPINEITLLFGKVEYDKTFATLLIQEDNVFNNSYTKIELKRTSIIIN